MCPSMEDNRAEPAQVSAQGCVRMIQNGLVAAANSMRDRSRGIGRLRKNNASGSPNPCRTALPELMS